MHEFFSFNFPLREYFFCTSYFVHFDCDVQSDACLRCIIMLTVTLSEKLFKKCFRCG